MAAVSAPGSTRVGLRAVAEIDPYPFYGSLRSDASATWDDSMDAWLVAEYDDCLRIQRDHETFAHSDAELFDPDRARPLDHLSFNRGMRTCPGAGLARTEATEFVIARAKCDVAYALGKRPPSFLGMNHRSYRPLNVTIGS